MRFCRWWVVMDESALLDAPPVQVRQYSSRGGGLYSNGAALQTISVRL
jgi:hypothetical protein